jgi:hypothetical protein
VQAFPLSEVKAYMGHADIQTTMIYVHRVPRHDAAARLSATVGAETGIDGSAQLKPTTRSRHVDARSGDPIRSLSR